MVASLRARTREREIVALAVESVRAREREPAFCEESADAALLEDFPRVLRPGPRAEARCAQKPR